jgi:hypothetical protein
MDLMTFVSMAAAFVLASGLWIWWKDGGSFHPFRERVCDRIRLALGIVSRDEMTKIYKQLQGLEQQWKPILAKVEATATASNRLEHVPKEIERRLANLEISDVHQASSVIGRVLPPRSIVRSGLRITISDALWDNLGIIRVEDVEDYLIDSLLQGPFCPVCLKKAVGRVRDKHSAVVPVHCRHCGDTWDCQGPLDASLSLVAWKRKVYDALDQEYRVNGTIQPYD